MRTIPARDRTRPAEIGATAALYDNRLKVRMVEELNRLDHICTYELDSEKLFTVTDDAGRIYQLNTPEAKETLVFLRWLRGGKS